MRLTGGQRRVRRRRIRRLGVRVPYGAQKIKAVNWGNKGRGLLLSHFRLRFPIWRERGDPVSPACRSTVEWRPGLALVAEVGFWLPARLTTFCNVVMLDDLAVMVAADENHRYELSVEGLLSVVTPADPGLVGDTGSYWSAFGEAVILGLIQIGGFAIMTLAALLDLVVAHQVRMRL